MPPDGTASAPENAAQELATLFPAPRSITVAGRTLEIRRCTIAQGGRILDVGIPIWQRLAAADDADPLTLFDEHPEDALALLIAATGMSAETFAPFDAADRFAIASAWMEVNAGFFVRRLLPSLLKMRGAIASAFGGGPTSSAT